MRDIIDNLKYEKEQLNQGITLIAGADEVGRGPLAGPVVCAAVIMPLDDIIDGIDDSKKLSEKKRELLYDKIMEKAIAVSVEFVDEKIIDEINILQATKRCMAAAINNLKIKPNVVFVDALDGLEISVPQKAIIKGDALSYSIGAASIIAKVTRDRFMVEMDKKYPEYGFAKNAGYGTKQHIEAIEKYGIIKEHRKTFKPVSDHLNHLYKK